MYRALLFLLVIDVCPADDVDNLLSMCTGGQRQRAVSNRAARHRMLS